MDMAGGDPACDAGRKRRRDRERGGEVLRHALEGGYSVHGAIAVVTAARAQIHCAGRVARMRAGYGGGSARFASTSSFPLVPASGIPRQQKRVYVALIRAIR